ncbi:hypothetical protein NDU88_001327 [Pleurodeles waltl]|uniref:Uncharacterized protein n=1 Tax=Pleurodeles waltl TaxID=8319 RepID=A0AAV7SBB9_PLEWA|nr:hypothetical protein NDU88_001327 [Pleurodeles waltl]
MAARPGLPSASERPQAGPCASQEQRRRSCSRPAALWHVIPSNCKKVFLPHPGTGLYHRSGFRCTFKSKLSLLTKERPRGLRGRSETWLVAEVKAPCPGSKASCEGPVVEFPALDPPSETSVVGPVVGAPVLDPGPGRGFGTAPLVGVPALDPCLEASAVGPVVTGTDRARRPNPA